VQKSVGRAPFKSGPCKRINNEEKSQEEEGILYSLREGVAVINRGREWVSLEKGSWKGETKEA